MFNTTCIDTSFNIRHSESTQYNLCELNSEYSPIYDAWDLVGLAVDFIRSAEKKTVEEPGCFKKMWRKLCGKAEYERAPQHLSDERALRHLVVSVKLSRRWVRVAVQECSVVFALALLSLCVYSIDGVETVERLNYTLTVLLTMVLYNSKTPDKGYLTLFDKYQLGVYLNIIITMSLHALDSELEGVLGVLGDISQFAVAISLFVILHVLWLGVCCRKAWNESKKSFTGHVGVKSLLRNQHRSERRKFISVSALDEKDESEEKSSEMYLSTVEQGCAKKVFSSCIQKINYKNAVVMCLLLLAVLLFVLWHRGLL